MAHDEFTMRALEEGRLDEAIRHLAEPERSAEDRRLLVQLLTYRGRFGEAESVLRGELQAGAATGTLSPDDWRERGYAAWRADHLTAALDDLHAALRIETDPAKAQRIQGDVGVLEEQIESLQIVARQFGRVEAATFVVVALLALAILWTSAFTLRGSRRAPGPASPIA